MIRLETSVLHFHFFPDRYFRLPNFFDLLREGYWGGGESLPTITRGILPIFIFVSIFVYAISGVAGPVCGGARGVGRFFPGFSLKIHYSPKNGLHEKLDVVKYRRAEKKLRKLNLS